MGSLTSARRRAPRRPAGATPTAAIGCRGRREPDRRRRARQFIRTGADRVGNRAALAAQGNPCSTLRHKATHLLGGAAGLLGGHLRKAALASGTRGAQERCRRRLVAVGVGGRGG